MAKKGKARNTEKRSLFKLRTAIIFGGVAVLVLCAGIILLFAGIRNVITPFSYPKSTLGPMPSETKFIEHSELVTKIAIPGTTYSMYVPDGSFAGDNAVFYDTYGQVTYAITHSGEDAETWIIGDLNKGVLNFYADGSECAFTSYVNDVGYLNGYELRYYAGVASTKALGQDNEIYSATYELVLNDGTYLLLSVATLNKHYLEDGKVLLDAMIYTLVLDDENTSIGAEEQGSEDVVDVVGPEYAVDEDGHIVGEVDGVWYEYLNMQDYMSELWTEELLNDGKYRYEVSLGLNHEYNSDTLYVELYYNSDDIFDNSLMENIYVTCTEYGAVNYGRHIRPYMQYPGYLYFEIENFEDAYLSYVFHGVSDCRITSFTPESFSADEWEDYLGIYPEDMIGDEHGVPTGIEEESADVIESVED